MSDGGLAVTVSGIGDAWVEVVELDVEAFTALQVVQEGVIRLLRASLVRVGQVDKIGAVRYDMLILLVAV